MATDRGTLQIDEKKRQYTFGGTSRTLIEPKQGDYKNGNAFELYIHTPLETKTNWKTRTKIQTPKTIIPEYININAGDFKQIKTQQFFIKDPLKRFELYYCKDANPNVALVVGFVTQNNKTYYAIREINGSPYSLVEVSSFRKIQESNLLEELYKENYNKNKTLTIKINGISVYHNVQVKNEEVSETEFHKYIHTPSGTVTSHENSVLDCNYKCTFKGFKANEYSNTKLKEVAVYFNKNDTDNRVPLLIEFKPKDSQQFSGNSNGKSVYYELKSLEERKLEGDKSEWARGIENVNSVDNIAERLNEIYHGELKYKIYDILGISDNSTVIGAVSGTVGTISAIGTGVGGFFIYKNSALVATFLKSLF